MEKKAKVFVIMPFSDDFFALYDELKRSFEDNFDFSNAGDLDNQQNILQDIVEGIYQADVIIADLTGLNANVFYEFGLAHAMNKKVIIITQDLGELPFDIKSYRANEYSLQFNKIPKLIEELKKLLFGAIDNSVKYGNPVTDYIPNYQKYESANLTNGNQEDVINEDDSKLHNVIGDEEEKGFLDYITDIDEYSARMTEEITLMSNEMEELNTSINVATEKVSQVQSQSGNLDVGFARNICRKLADPIDGFAKKLKGHVGEVSKYWDIVENSYLSLLDNQYVQSPENITEIKKSMDELKGMQENINSNTKKIEEFRDMLRVILGFERRLNKATTSLIYELEGFSQMVETMFSSIDRILSKSQIIIDNIMENQ